MIILGYVDDLIALDEGGRQKLCEKSCMVSHLHLHQVAVLSNETSQEHQNRIFTTHN